MWECVKKFPFLRHQHIFQYTHTFNNKSWFDLLILFRVFRQKEFEFLGPSGTVNIVGVSRKLIIIFIFAKAGTPYLLFYKAGTSVSSGWMLTLLSIELHNCFFITMCTLFIQLWCCRSIKCKSWWHSILHTSLLVVFSSLLCSSTSILIILEWNWIIILHFM